MPDGPTQTSINPALTGKRAEAARLWAATPWQDVALFIGPNAARFEPVWAQMRTQTLQAGGGFARGLCWPALFFGFAWFFYRKLWGWGVAFLVLPVAIGWFLPVKGAAIGFAAATAALGKTAYVQHATTRAAVIRAAGGDDAALAAAGGTSVAGALVGAAILLLAVVAVGLAAASGMPAPA